MRKFKVSAIRCDRELAEITDLAQAWHALAESSHRTCNVANQTRNEFNRKFRELLAQKDEILTCYREGINGLKNYKLHQNLWKDSSQEENLIDIYYNESAMNSFKNSCVVQLEKLVLKLDNKPLPAPKALEIDTAEVKKQASSQRNELQDVQECEPLLISILHTVHSDLKQVHAWFDALKLAYVVDNTRMIELDEICINQKGLLKQARKHVQSAESLLQKIQTLKFEVARRILGTKNQLAQVYRKPGFALKDVRQI